MSEKVAREASRPGVLLSREKAAEHLGISTKSFDRHVRPHVQTVNVGSMPKFVLEDLDRWVDEQRGCASNGAEVGHG
ncbi:MAG TPA: hypothetical protein VGY54_21110, partial [Polyangiaceae bacterium]|nr:hypothetical protein [Polyangiaceae bacterium]